MDSTNKVKAMDLTQPSDEKLEKKAEIMQVKLIKREEGRLAGVEKKRQEKESIISENEKISRFSIAFAKLESSIEESLTHCNESIPKDHLERMFDSISLLYQQFQKTLSDATLFLPTSELGYAQKKINELQDAIKSKRKSLMPKKKFTFKDKKIQAKPKTTETQMQRNDITKEGAENDRPESESISGTSEFGVKNREHETITLSGSNIFKKDVMLTSLTSCTIKLHGLPSTLHMSNLKKCTILTGPVSTSIFIDDSVDCNFVLACQQLRIHATSASNFYINVTSRAIIEDCSSLKFAPYNYNYENMNANFSEANLDMQGNNWKKIDDFNWLSTDIASPNWVVMEEHEKCSNWNIL